MKISVPWLKELVDLNVSVDELLNLLPLRSVSIKNVSGDCVELDMKGYNRADLLSLRGVALEVAAITDSQIKFIDEDPISNFNVPQIKVKVENPNLAPYYVIAKIENLKVEYSSDTWVKKLSDLSLRAINNVADVTNLIMMEYGQPMHAFDARAVKDEEITVRTAKKGERITTLDGKVRDLETSDLLITDSLNALGIAGVMGGKDSEINESTTTILLEAAIFDPVNIRKTSTRLGLTSEASKRFQHGLTKKRLLQALDAAIKMYEQLGGKLVAINLVGNFEDKVRKITLSKKKLEGLVGVKFEDKQIEGYLKSLYFQLATKGNALRAWEITAPYFRLDTELEEDVIEEVARMYGYEKIPSGKVSESKPLQKEDPIFKKIWYLKQRLVNLGLTEVQTYSFYSTQVIEALGWNNKKDEYMVKVANPISSETEYLRQNIWPNLIEVVGKNLRKGYKDIAIFEIGKAFDNVNGSPNENYHLAIALMNGSDNPIAELLNLANSLKIAGTPGLLGNHTLFHPTRITNNMAEVHLRVLNKLRIEKRVAILELKLLN